MRKIIPALAVAFCSFLLLISVAYVGKHRSSQQAQLNTAQREINHKEVVLEADLEQTRHLHRANVNGLIKSVLNDYEDGLDPTTVLTELQKKHPHMIQLSWVGPLQSFEQAIQIGEVPAELKPIVAKTKKEALHFLKKQHRIDTFQSSPIHSTASDEEYFVIGAAKGEHGPYIVGLMHQHLLKQLKTEQKKNLRIVPYPSDKRYNIQAIDADSLHKVRVNSAEDNEGTSHYHIQQVVVKFTNELRDQQLAQINSDLQASVIHHVGNTYVFQSVSNSVEDMMSYFQAWDIVFVEPHFLYMTNEVTPPQYIPNDVLFESYQWNLPMINTINGWDLSRGSSDVIVAVIDTGIDLNHADLAHNLVEGINVIDQTAAPLDDVGHGTHVAGVIAATVNNYEGVAGMSWYNKVMPIKALDHTGAGSTYAVAQGIIWATDNGAKVINMSLGNYIPSQFLHDAIQYAYERDVVLVAASGNDDTIEPGYPAAYPEVLAVAATNAYQQRASFSNYGDYIDVAAPGEHIASTYPDNEYAAMSGTSMASPHVAALAAMIRSANPLLTNGEVMEIIKQSALDLGSPGHDFYYGFGQIDVVTALQHATNTTTVLATEPSFFQQMMQYIANAFKKKPSD